MLKAKIKIRRVQLLNLIDHDFRFLSSSIFVFFIFFDMQTNGILFDDIVGVNNNNNNNNNNVCSLKQLSAYVVMNNFLIG